MTEFLCATCGGSAFHWVRNGTNRGRQTRARRCDVCHPPAPASNRGRATCVRDGTSRWVEYFRDGLRRRRCVECMRRSSEAARRADPAKHREAVRRTGVKYGRLAPREDDPDPWVQNQAAIDAAIGGA